MSVHEVAMGLAFITATLKADSQWVALSPGGARRGAAPAGSPYPVTIYAFQSGSDVIYTNAIRSSVDVLYQVKASGPIDSSGGSQAVFDLAARIDDLLKKTKGTTTGGIILGCYRESPLAYDDNTAGVQYAHMGGLYRVRSQQQ